MIDTDKYEGHTEGPWEIIEREVPNPQWDVMLSCPEVGKFASIQGSNGWRPTEVELELIADAPLLLAEVKRLQKELRKQTNIVGMISDLVYDGGSHNLTWDELNEILGDVVKE